MSVSIQPVHFYVTDAATRPIQNALCKMTSLINGQGNGTSGYTDANGYLFLDAPFSPNWWLVQKDGYTTQSGNYPPLVLNIALQSGATQYAVSVGRTGSGSVAATINGTPIDVTKVNYAPAGSTLVVTATPSSGNYLKNWLKNTTQPLDPTNPITVTTPASTLSLYAVFEQSWVLTILPSPYGSTNPVAGSYATVNGQQVTVVAIPNSGYVIDHWNINGGTVAGAYTQITFTVNQALLTLEAVFKAGGQPPPDKYNLVITTTGNGTTNPSGTVQVNKNSQQSISATPSNGFVFDHWEVNDVRVTDGSNPLIVTVDRDNFRVHAVFVGGSQDWPVERVMDNPWPSSAGTPAVVQADVWTSGKSKDTNEIDVGDLTHCLGVRITYNITYKEGGTTFGNWGPGQGNDADVGIDFNGVNVYKARFMPGSLGTSKNGSFEIPLDLIKQKNKATVGQTNYYGAWNKFVYDIQITFGYSQEPTKDPSQIKDVLDWFSKLEWWQWGLIGLGGAGVIILARPATGATVINLGRETYRRGEEAYRLGKEAYKKEGEE